jgi:tRNA G10  N-methylase Trm11
MGQQFKNIYFADYPAESARERNLTLAFGGKDGVLYEGIKSLTSHEIRERLGHANHRSLTEAAQRESLPLNTYCLRLLRDAQARPPAKTNGGLFRQNGTARPLIDAIQATFRGGQSEPLHGWYPYLEGYSPLFVEQVLQEFAPHAERILDPFGGTGTTPLTAAKLGREAFFCELNPLLQFLVEAKTLASNLGDKQREDIAGRLLELVDSLSERIAACRPDAELQAAYTATFSDSQFFDVTVYDAVLRARTTIDLLACESPLAAKFLTVAVLASLIPASRLIRRGDVRFKTGAELKRFKTGFTDCIKKQLRLMAHDLKLLQPLQQTPKLVCDDARRLQHLLPLDIDAVVTSPPYLNGTNYFRNTKVELWFLRCLRTADDLADFRLRTVTAGINDVTNAKLNSDFPKQARALVAQLEESAYDIRIPRMVASYFNDMRAVFSALKKHLTAQATLMLDIGDSAYGNIHVPTDKLLTGIFSDLGFSLRREVILRKRMSRGGFALRQVLLVFDLPKARVQPMHDRADLPSPRWEKSWNAFKRDLPHQAEDFAKRNWGHPLHSLCSYQGKMKPSLAHHLVKTFVPDGGRMLDPFGGVGTIPFEAALEGIHSWSFDISPAGYQIATAKVGLPQATECARAERELESFIEAGTVETSELAAARKIHFNGLLPDYFSPKTFKEILLARRFFNERPPRSASEALVFASLLHILHGNRPYALSRRSHPITPFAPTGPAEFRPLMPRLREKVARSLETPRSEQFHEGKVIVQDATSWWPREVCDLDAIITSPPFFDSTRFYLANWMRLWFCGWEANDFRVQPLAYVDERQKQGFEIYEPIFRQARERLKADGVLVLHLGKSRKCDMAQELVKVAVRWFRVADIFTETVEHCESHGIRDKGTVTAHQFLILR